MPPLYQDPLSAVPAPAWTFAEVARAALAVCCEPWALALIALAAYSFLEREVKGVLKAALPLALALGAVCALALAARAVGGVPQPLDGAGHLIRPLLRRAFPSEHAAAVAVFATYTALAYGRRAAPVVLAAGAIGVARALGGAHWAPELAAGGVSGFVAAFAVHRLTVRLVPRGHLARLRALRSARREGQASASP